MSSAGIGALLGLVAMGGLLLAVSRWDATRPLPLDERIAPYVPQARSAVVDEPSAFAAVLALLRPGLRLVSAERGLAGRLVRAGRADDRQRFRLEQVTACGIGMAAGLLAGLVLALRGSSLAGTFLLALVGGVAAVLWHDRRLSRQGVSRQRRIAGQLPTAAELLAFAVAAGESPAAALGRVAQTVHGELADELRQAIAETRGGASFQDALQGVGRRCSSAEVQRFVDGIVLAIERGTPIAEVLRAQAADARAAQSRALVEAGSKRDSLMLVPVVFLILPIVVLVALFPGFQTLQLVVP